MPSSLKYAPFERRSQGVFRTVSGFIADRHFKPPFSLPRTLSPNPQAVNRTAFGKNSPLARIIRTPRRPEAADLDAV